MLLIIILLGILFIITVLFLYCSLILASKCDENIEYYQNLK